MLSCLSTRMRGKIPWMHGVHWKQVRFVLIPLCYLVILHCFLYYHFFTLYIYTHTYIYIYIYTHIYIYHYCVWRKRAEWSLASGFVYSIHVTVFLFRQFKFHSDWIFAFLNFWFIIRTELIIHLDLLLNYLLVH